MLAGPAAVAADVPLPRFFGVPPPAHALSQPRLQLSSVDGTTQIAEVPAEAQFLESPRVHFSEVPSRQGRRLLQRGATAATPPRHAPRRRGVCHHASLPAAKYALTPAMVRRHTAPPNTLIVTFANPQHGAFALNWARLLDGLGLPSLVGTAARLDVERELRAAGAGVFCADGPLMQANGQAGRWAEVAPLLGYGVDVLLSDADVAWIRNPLPYFAAARRAHPAADLLMLTDRAFNNYATAPLPAAAARRPRAAAAAGPATEAAAAKARASLAGDLDLEDAYDSSISYNIGVIYMYAGSNHQRTGAGANPNANASLASLFEAWVGAVRDDEHKGAGGLSVWDQAPINDRVLKRGMGRHPTDPSLVSIFGGRLAMGVLPMLQFTTSFTYFIHRARRESLGCRPYALHAIFAHGKDEPRKRMIFREEMLWHDPPEYYSAGSFLSYEPDAPPPHLQKEGGFELIVHQLRTFQSALALAAALGRALVLPSLRCGAAPMAYPCYAWYHRAYAHFGFNLGKTPMPEVCPIYYWFDAGGAERDGLAIREPSFLRNPRTPANVSHDVATLTLCARRNETGCRGGAPSSSRDVVAPARTSAAALRAALRAAGAASARVLSVRGMRLLQLSDAEGDGTVGAAEEGKGADKRAAAKYSRGNWCTDCAVTRKAASVGDLNRTTVRELEHFCRAEARLKLGYPKERQFSAAATCCTGIHGGCRPCAPRGVIGNASEMGWFAQQWLPVWASLEPPEELRGTHGRFRCAHPLCSGSDHKRWP